MRFPLVRTAGFPSAGLAVSPHKNIHLEHNISRNAYYYWLRKVKEAAIEQSGSLFAEVNPSFTAVTPGCSGASSVSICLGDAVIHVNEGTSGHLIHTVIEAVRNA